MKNKNLSLKKNRNIFSIAGMPRAGTTWLFENLKHHPRLFAAPYKETSFFTENWNRGWSWLTKRVNFNDECENYILDCGPEYFIHPEFTKNTAQFNGNLKLIIVIRDKVDWIKSLFNHMSKNDNTIISESSFQKKYYFKNYDRKFTICFDQFSINDRKKEILNMGHDVLFIDYKTLITYPIDTITRIENFLEVPISDATKLNAFKNYNRSENKSYILIFLTKFPKFKSTFKRMMPTWFLKLCYDFMVKFLEKKT